MNIRRESHCPVCRRAYMYFPRVCRLIHFMLMKTVPEEYERRSLEIQRTEELKQIFSPRFQDSPRHGWSPRDYEEAARLKAEKLILSSTPRGDIWPAKQLIQDVAFVPSCNEEKLKEVSEQKGDDLCQRDINYMQKTLSKEDVLCGLCQQLVYLPVILNCGEVFCEPCLKHEASTIRQCPSCKSLHPGGPVRVCLELHQFLQSVFPDEYTRKEQEVASQINMDNNQILDSDSGDECQGNLHEGVGCDGCGMYPIVGLRYKCKDCTEKIGYDLCGSCYKKGESVLGRFNQAHQPSHEMVQINSRMQPLIVFNIGDGTIQRRRQQNQQSQQQMNHDLDAYIDSFLG